MGVWVCGCVSVWPVRLVPPLSPIRLVPPLSLWCQVNRDLSLSTKGNRLREETKCVELRQVSPSARDAVAVDDVGFVDDVA